MDTVTAAGLLGMIMSAFAAFAVWYALILAARWLLFNKAGLSGWKSLIPFYSDYCTYKIAWNTKFFWIVTVCGIISAFVSGRVSTLTENGEAVPVIFSLLTTVTGLAVTIINLMMNINLSNKFGHGILFGLGLTFLTPVFTLILGLGSSRYLGNPEMGLKPEGGGYGAF